MQNAIIVHGKPSREEYYDPALPSESNAHWLPWLQKQLLRCDIHAVTPEMPQAFDPDYQVWQKEVERYEITSNTMLVGHSCGSGFWVRYLSEHPDLHVGKVVLVAPWLDPDGDETRGFFDFKIDPAIAALREQIKDVQYKEFHKYGHFCFRDMGMIEFPELLTELVEYIA